MALPKPEPGLVISYDYLWSHQHRRGEEQGRKTRPSVIVVVIANQANGAVRVAVAPITHRRPDHPVSGIEMPQRVKVALTLDGEPSWIMCDELNHFIWPGFDLRQLPKQAGRYEYGFLPPALFDAVAERMRALDSRTKLKRVARD